MRPGRFEAWTILAVALGISAGAWLVPFVERSRFRPPTAPPTVLHPELLTSASESAEVDVDSWLRLATSRPAAFAASAAFCRQHRALPLPNCRNLRTADDARAALSEGGRAHAS